MPVVNLAESFNRESASGDAKFMVTVRSADRQLALVVDEMIGRRELVTRPLPAQVGSEVALSGGAVPLPLTVLQPLQQQIQQTQTLLRQAQRMADWLGQDSKLPVRVAREGERPAPGGVLLAGTNELVDVLNEAARHRGRISAVPGRRRRHRGRPVPPCRRGWPSARPG